jgi:electron transfer DM13
MFMTIHISPWLLRRKWILITVGLPVLVALWWAFRPEKLWINQKVNEPAPFDTSADPQPILTGRFEGNARQTNGRATIYKKLGGEYLQLSDFTAPSGPDIHVALVHDDTQAKSGLDSLDLGPLKANQSHQNYNLPGGTDLNKYDTVLIYAERPHAVFGLAKLEPF